MAIEPNQDPTDAPFPGRPTPPPRRATRSWWPTTIGCGGISLLSLLGIGLILLALTSAAWMMWPPAVSPTTTQVVGETVTPNENEQLISCLAPATMPVNGVVAFTWSGQAWSLRDVECSANGEMHFTPTVDGKPSTIKKAVEANCLDLKTIGEGALAHEGFTRIFGATDQCPARWCNVARQPTPGETGDMPNTCLAAR